LFRAALLTALVLNLSLCSFCSPAKGDRKTPTTVAPPAARGQPAALALPSAYQDPDGFWSIRYPQGWQQVVRGSETQFRTGGSGLTGIAVSMHAKVVSPTGLAADTSSLLSGRTADYAIRDQHETSFDGHSAVEVAHTYRLGGAAVEGFMVALVRNRVGILILGYAPRERYSEVRNALRAIAASIDVIEYDVAPPYAQWRVHRGDSLTFRYLPDTYVAGAIDDIAETHARAYRENVRRLEADPKGTIDYYLYPSAEALYRATARRHGFAIAPQREVHALWSAASDHQSLGHEMTHVIAHGLWGEPSEALLGEGLAVCLDHATPHPHDRAAAWLDRGRLYPLPDMLGEAWFDLDPEVTYAQSGSIACWLLDRYGVDRFRQLYTAEDLPSALVEVYGLDVKALEREWLEAVGGR
jgi:hypothetical protein